MMNDTLASILYYADDRQHEKLAKAFSLLDKMKKLNEKSEKYNELLLEFNVDIGQYIAYQNIYFVIKSIMNERTI